MSPPYNRVLERARHAAVAAPPRRRTRRSSRCRRCCPRCPTRAARSPRDRSRARPTRWRWRNSARDCAQAEAHRRGRHRRPAVRATARPRRSRGSRPGCASRCFPDWETLPYDHFSPHQDLVSERLATLYRVSRGECDVVVVAATTALYRLAPPSYLAAFTFFLQQGERLDVERLRAQLALAGYAHVTQVVSPGEFSVRGGLIDLFPMGSPLPYRIDLFDDEIESIKTFDVDTQRTLYPVRDVRLLPAREFPLDDAGRTRFRSRFREVFEGDPSKSDAVQGHFARRRARRHRVLPAAVLRGDGDARRLPAAARDRRRCTATSTGAVERFWQDTESRWIAAARRQGAAAAAAHRAVPAARRSSTARSSRSRASNSRAAATGPTAPAAAGAGRPPRRRSARRAEALPRHAPTRASRSSPKAPGRRETMQQYFAEYGLAARAGRRLSPRSPRGDRARRARRRPARVGLRVARRRSWRSSPRPSSTRTSCAAACAKRRGARTSTRWCATSPRCASAIPSSTSSTASAATSACVTLDLGDGANEFLQLVYANDAKLYVPVVEPAPHQPLQRRVARRGAAARARQRAMGEGEEEGGAAGARHGGRAAQPLRAARGAQGLRVRLQAARLRGVRRRLRLRGDRRPGGGDRGGDRRHDVRASRWTGWSAATSASARPKSRCAPRSSRWPTASRWRCSCRRRCSPSSTSRRSPTASPTRRCASPSCRASARRRK